MRGLLCMTRKNVRRRLLSIPGNFDGGLQPIVAQTVYGMKNVGIAVRKQIRSVQHKRDRNRLAGRAHPDGAQVSFALLNKVGDSGNGTVRSSHWFSPWLFEFFLQARFARSIQRQGRLSPQPAYCAARTENLFAARRCR